MFTKLYSRITESSLMEQPIEVRYTFIMLLAIADPTGRVVGTDVAIARRLNMPLDSFVNSVKQLGEPDLDSNSKEEEGRRVIPSDSERGYQLVNYIKYRNLKDEEEKREYMREYMRKRREDEALRKTCKTVLNDVKNVTQAEAEAEAEAEANSKKNKKRFKEPSIEEVNVRCAEIGLPDSEAERFWNYHAAKGWVVGNQPMRSWVAALNTWKLNGQKFNQGARGPFKAKSTPTRADGEFCPGWQDKDQKDMTDREIVALAGGL